MTEPWTQILSEWVHFVRPRPLKLQSLRSNLLKATRLSLSQKKTLSSGKPRLAELLAHPLSKQLKIQLMTEIWTLRFSTKARLRALSHKLVILAYSLNLCQKLLSKGRKQRYPSMLAITQKIVVKEKNKKKAKMKRNLRLMRPRTSQIPTLARMIQKRTKMRCKIRWQS